MLDIVVLSIGLMIHMWSLPYPFKNVRFDLVVRVFQILFGLAVLSTADRGALQIDTQSLIAGFGVGGACLVFHIIINRGIKLRPRDLRLDFIASQLIILGIQIPAEELLYRGVFFTVLNSLWGPGTALLFSASLSTMIYVATWRKPLYWGGAALVSILCGLGYYYSGSVWSPILIHVLNDIGYVTLDEKRNLFR